LLGTGTQNPINWVFAFQFLCFFLSVGANTVSESYFFFPCPLSLFTVGSWLELIFVLLSFFLLSLLIFVSHEIHLPFGRVFSLLLYYSFSFLPFSCSVLWLVWFVLFQTLLSFLPTTSFVFTIFGGDLVVFLSSIYLSNFDFFFFF